MKREDCPCEKSGNTEVIDSFINYLKVRFNVTCNDRKTSTYRFSLGYLFTYEDSLLNYEISKDSSFKLIQLVDFNHSEYRELSDPTDWLMREAGDHSQEAANDRVEGAKAWKRWNRFIRDELNKSRLKHGPSNENLCRYQLLIKNLDDLHDKIDKSNIDKQAKIMQNVAKRAKENAQEYLQPNKRLAEKDCVKNWFNSEIYKTELDEAFKIYWKIMDDGDRDDKDFTKFGQFAKFYLMVTSKNRNAVFNISNYEYRSRTPLWIVDTEEEEDEFLPSGWITEPPSDNPNMPPNVWIIKRSGSGPGIKNQEAQTIYINQACHEILEKYCDIKSELIGNESVDSPFFVKLDGSKLPEIANTRYTLWGKFAKVSNLPKASMNTIRRGLEYEVQKSPAALGRIKEIQSHSQETGSGAYNKLSPLVRACFMNQISNNDSSNSVPQEELPQRIQEARNKRDEMQRIQCSDAARETISKKTRNRKGLSKTTRVLPDDRTYLEQIFVNSINTEISEAVKGKFPNNLKFKELFYRLLDGFSGAMPNEKKERLTKIEERIFLSIKKDVENEFCKPWENGSEDMNRSADKKVCAAIRNSIYCHERNKTDDETHVFTFGFRNVKS